MAMALFGALLALVTMRRYHDRQLARLTVRPVPRSNDPV
jgi:hypothetical protein